MTIIESFDKFVQSFSETKWNEEMRLNDIKIGGNYSNRKTGLSCTITDIVMGISTNIVYLLSNGTTGKCSVNSFKREWD